MKNRFLSFLLALLLLISICPVYAAEQPELTGEEVAIFYPAENKVMTTESYYYEKNSKYELKSANATLVDGMIETTASDIALFTMQKDGDVTTFKTSDGRYLYADGKDVRLVDTESDYTKFVIEEADGGVYIRCATAKYYSKAQYLEYMYSYFTVFSLTEANAQSYVFQLCPVNPENICLHNWDKTAETAATCTKSGNISYICSLCGAAKNEAVPAIGHKYENGVCTVCGAVRPSADEEIGIFSSVENKIMTTEENSYTNSSGFTKLELTSAKATVQDDRIVTDAENAARFTLTENDGTVSFVTSDGKYLYADGTDVKLADTVSAYTKFVLEEAAGGTMIRCASATFNGKPQYLEYFKGYFSVFTLSADTAIFTFGLYPFASNEDCEHHWEKSDETAATCTKAGNITYTCLLCGVVKNETVPATGHSFEDGKCTVCGAEQTVTSDQIVIFYPSENKVITTESYYYEKNAKDELKTADAKLVDGEVETAAGNVAKFTVIDNNGTVTFATDDGRYLYADGTHVRLVETEGEYTKFVIEETSGGVYIRCATAENYNRFQYLEYMYGYISVYSLSSDKAEIYTFALYPLKETEKPCEHTNTELRNALAATCEVPGYTGDIYCKDCGELLGNGTVIAALGHAYEVLAAVAPTCTEPGLTGGACCSRCGDILLAQQQIPALGHNYVDGCCARCGEAEPTEPIETEPVDTEPFETQPIETEPIETEPIETEPIETEPIETEPTDPKDPCEGYTDIDRSAWYHAAADFVIARGIMGSTKTDSLTFEPFTVCTRAMIATMLYSLKGKPQASYQPVFPDVGEGQWYTDAVMWAYQCGVVTGYDNGKFGPNDKVTREQMAVILKAYAEKVQHLDTSKTDDLSRFADANKVTWSKPYITWAVAEGLISGKAAGDILNLDPQGNATRAEVAAIIKSFITNFLDAE